MAEPHKDQSVSLSNLDTARFSADRNAKYRALGWLEEAGLIAVRRKIGQSPGITLLDGRTEDEPS